MACGCKKKKDINNRVHQILEEKRKKQQEFIAKKMKFNKMYL
jgi:hypothetical protein